MLKSSVIVAVVVFEEHLCRCVVVKEEGPFKCSLPFWVGRAEGQGGSCNV